MRKSFILDYIIFHHFYSIRNHSHSIRNHSLVKSHRYSLSMFVEDINSLFEKMWNECHFFLNLNYNDDIKWIQWISFLIKYNSKINTDLLQMLISYLITIILRLKYVFISYQTFIDTSCIKYSRLYLIFFNLFFRTQEIFQIPINRYDLSI